MLDRDLAERYGVETKRLKEQVRRNIERFPDGVNYALTLHDSNNTRILGFDNADAFKPEKMKYGARKITWDHKHKMNKVRPYEFESINSMAQLLSSENQKLLKVINEKKPTSLKELEIATGRKSSNLSRTLKMMSRYGIVDLVKLNQYIKPVVKATDFKVEFGINSSAL